MKLVAVIGASQGIVLVVAQGDTLGISFLDGRRVAIT